MPRREDSGTLAYELGKEVRRLEQQFIPEDEQIPWRVDAWGPSHWIASGQFAQFDPGKLNDQDINAVRNELVYVYILESLLEELEKTVDRAIEELQRPSISVPGRGSKKTERQIPLKDREITLRGTYSDLNQYRIHLQPVKKKLESEKEKLLAARGHLINSHVGGYPDEQMRHAISQFTVSVEELVQRDPNRAAFNSERRARISLASLLNSDLADWRKSGSIDAATYRRLKWQLFAAQLRGYIESKVPERFRNLVRPRPKRNLQVDQEDGNTPEQQYRQPGSSQEKPGESISTSPLPRSSVANSFGTRRATWRHNRDRRHGRAPH